MKIADSTTVVRKFRHYLSLAEHGESIRIRKHGRSVARLVPDTDFMSGQQAADVFRSHKADHLDRAAARAIESEISRLDREAADALAH